MASDLVVALGQAAVNGTPIFGANHYAPRGRRQRLHLSAGAHHPPDELVPIPGRRLPQARQTCTALGCQPEGSWGFVHGVNESHVAVGVTGWHSRLPAAEGGLCGTDLTRLALERSHTALQALDVLTDLISRHGQAPERGAAGPADNIFLVADRQEAFALEAAGRYWAVLECRQVRAVTDVAMIRQDWHRIAPGLAALAIEHGWWDDDGSKLDFTACLDARAPAHSAARRRWGRATLALEQQNGAIDGHFLRRMLLDHPEHNAARTHRPPAPPAGSFLTALANPDEPALAWCAFGVPRAAVYFPVWLDAELPAALHGISADGADVWRQTQDLLALAETVDADHDRLAETLERLQTIFDQDVEGLLPQARRWKRQGDRQRLQVQTTTLMQKHVSMFVRECRQLHGPEEREPVRVYVDDFVSYIS
jgi:hypothetical protein